MVLNIQNDCHQWLSDSFRVHQIFSPARTPLGELTALPVPLAGSGGLLLREREEEGYGKSGGGGKKGKGRTGPLTQIPGSALEG